MKRRLLFLIVALAPFFVKAGEPVDLSRADFDGPYVFFRKGKAIVKSVHVRDSVAMLDVKTYERKSNFMLRCTIPATGDAFEFTLKDSLRNEPDVYECPEKMLAISDIEGNFQALKMMLMGAKVIDHRFRWTFGKGHLVLLGDYFDRGLNVTECLWLIYKLENEALAAGGKVHFILGNHEIINLKGETHYVRRKYIENLRILDEPYHRLFNNQTELGRWLRTKNAVEKIGQTVYCHGGISPELAATQMTLSDINRLSRENLGRDNADITNDWAKAVFNEQTGIFWYRKAAKNLLNMNEMTEILNFAGAERMVVGHTLQPDISSYYKGRLICIDLYYEEYVRIGFVKALWLDKGQPQILDSNGTLSTLFSVEMRTAKQ